MDSDLYNALGGAYQGTYNGGTIRLVVDNTRTVDDQLDETNGHFTGAYVEDPFGSPDPSPPLVDGFIHLDWDEATGSEQPDESPYAGNTWNPLQFSVTTKDGTLLHAVGAVLAEGSGRGTHIKLWITRDDGSGVTVGESVLLERDDSRMEACE